MYRPVLPEGKPGRREQGPIWIAGLVLDLKNERHDIIKQGRVRKDVLRQPLPASPPRGFQAGFASDATENSFQVLCSILLHISNFYLDFEVFKESFTMFPNQKRRARKGKIFESEILLPDLDVSPDPYKIVILDLSNP